MSSNEAKARALALRALGRSYREIAADIKGTLKESVSHQTVAEWCNADPELQGRANQAKLQRIVDRDTEIGVRAGELLDEMLPSLSPRDMVTAYGVNRDKILTWVRTAQDNRHHNEQLDAIRAELRAKGPAHVNAAFQALIATSSDPEPPQSASRDRDREERRAREQQLQRYRSLDN
jgi:hypothetical protein